MTMLLERIRNDRDQARKDGNTLRRDCLGFLMAEALALGKNSKPPREPTDVDVIATIRKLIGQNEELSQYRPLNDTSDTDADRENAILKEYLPIQMNETQLTEVIKELLGGEKSPRLLGPVMKTLQAQHPGEYDPALASRITKSLLVE